MLYVLPFDHRGSFQRMLFPDTPADQLSDEQHDAIRDYKRVCFDALKMVGEKRGLQDLAVLVDEQYGMEIHKECKELGLRNMLTMEKSGQKVFDFEYSDWKDHLKNIQPAYAKALIRIEPGADNTVQNERLKELNDFCAEEGILFLIEPLIGASEEDMASVNGDKEAFDRDLRPGKFAAAVQELHAAGVTPDVWKIEGCENAEGMKISSDAVQEGGKDNVEIVILGRGAGMDKVEQWLKVGAQGDKVSGFAVGRTIFAEPVMAMQKGEMTREETVQKIAELYDHCIQVFESAR